MTNEHDAKPATQTSTEENADIRAEGRDPKNGGHGPHPVAKPRGRRLAYAGAGLALVVIGAGAISLARPTVQMAPLAPVATSAMASDSVVTIKGKVSEIYGNKFVLQDDSGRALVETGRAGEGGKLVRVDEPVTVQGRFDGGFLRAAFIVRADGKTDAIGPMGPGPHDHGPKRRLGPDDAPRGLRDGSEAPMGQPGERAPL
jgi:hypothetical protein